MKKLLLLMAGVAAASGLQAGELNMYMGQQLLENSKTYYFNDIEVSDEGGYFEVKMDPKLSIVADETTYDVKIVATCTSGQEIQMCAGGACENGTSVTKEGLILKAGKAVDLMFEYLGEAETQEQIPTCITTDFTLEEVGVATSKKTYTVVMNDPNGAVSVIAQDKQVVLMNNTLVYSLSGDATVELYDINGRKVLSSQVNGSGNLNLGTLAKGLFIYRFAGCSKAIGKILLH